MGASARIDELRKRYDENQRRFFAPLANEYRKAGDLEQAIALCRLHLADSPANLSGQIVFGQALYDAGSLDDARATFETAIGLDPENLIALRHLGDIARAQSDVPRAMQWYQRVLDADRRNEDVLAIVAELSALGPAAAEAQPEQAGLAGEPAAAMREPAAPPGDVPQASRALEGAPAPVPVLASAPRASTASLIGFGPPPAPEAPTPPPSTPAPEPAESPQESAEFESVAFPVVEEALAGMADAGGTPDAVPLPDAPTVPPAVPPAVLPDARISGSALDEPGEPESAAFEAASFPVVEPSPPQAAALDFGLVAPDSAGAEPATHEAPDSSFGFDVDLDAAAGIPVAATSEVTPDFGVVELREPPTFDEPPIPETSAFSETIEIAEPTDELLAVSDLDVAPPDAPAPVERSFSFDLSTFDAPVRPVATPTPTPTSLAADALVEPAFDIVPEPAVESGVMAPSELEATGDAPDGETDEEFVARAYAPPISEQVTPSFSPAVPDVPAEEPVVAELEPTPVVAQVPILPETPVVASTPVASTTPAGAFETETMAEVYARQGLRHEAIAVYRRLVDARPGDESLRRRLAELEDDRHVSAGPTARSFFAGLSSRRKPRLSTPAVAPTPTFLLESVPPVEPEVSKAVDAVPVPVADLAPEVAPAPTSALGGLFGDASVASYDAAAANALSAAFGEVPAPTDPPAGAGEAGPPAAGEVADDAAKLRSWLDDMKKP